MRWRICGNLSAENGATGQAPDAFRDAPVVRLRQFAHSKEYDMLAKMNAYIEQVMEQLSIPGLAVAVTRGGKTVYTGAFGIRDLDTGKAMRPECLFHMASVSKPFVATAIVQLVEQGKMDLGEPVVTYLPYFGLADERCREITIRQMLNHTSGMPGERYRYSNMAFEVLDDVIAKVSGRPFETCVKEHILDALGMTESTFLREETSEELRTTPHVWRLTPTVSEIYPEVSNTYDSLGEAYMVAGQKELAISNYQKSLELDPGNTSAIEMLKKLQ